MSLARTRVYDVTLRLMTSLRISVWVSEFGVTSHWPTHRKPVVLAKEMLFSFKEKLHLKGYYVDMLCASKRDFFCRLHS